MRKFSLRVLEFDKVKKLVEPFVVSSSGRKLLADCKPLESQEQIEWAHDETQELAVLRATGQPLPTRDFPDCRSLVVGIDGGGALPGAREMGELLALLKAWAAVFVFFNARREEAPRLGQLVGEKETLADFRERLAEIVDVQGRVHDQATPRLYTLRRSIEEQDRRLHNCLRQLAGDSRLSRHLRSGQISWRQGRPVLQVRTANRMHVPGIVHDHSQSGGTVFIEPREAIPLVNIVSELREDERAEVRRLMAELTRAIAQRRDDLEKTFAAAAEFDFICAKAEFMSHYSLAVPEIVGNWPLQVKAGRHPILASDRIEKDGHAGSVVPMDIVLGGDYDTIVVTGPNTGGKTVALKCIGLVAIMAMSGLPVFAESARIPLLNAVFADIGDEQEISQNLSTFSGHMQRVVGILAGADQNTLVLLDELGAGTDPAEGGVLGYAILERLLALKAKVLASTHIGVLKTFALNFPRAVNGAMEFDPQTLNPLYSLCVGMPGLSNALVIARRLGLEPAVLKRAESMIDRPDGGIAFLVEKLQESRLAAEKSRRNLQRLEGMADDRVELLEEQSRVMKEREEILHLEADQRAHDLLRQAREALSARLKPLIQMSGPSGDHARQAATLVDELLRWSPLANQREEFLGQLRVGDTVRVPRFRFCGPITKLKRKKQRVVIMRNKIPIEVPFDDIIPDEK